MEKVSKELKISVKEAEAHYQSSKENYEIEGTESHLAYYREKHLAYYDVLLNNVLLKSNKMENYKVKQLNFGLIAHHYKKNQRGKNPK